MKKIMLPYYPENTKQLQSQGLLDLGMRLLQAGGPQQQGMGFGARLGQAGTGNLQAMRGAGQQMMQNQAMKQKMEQAKAVQQHRINAAEDFKNAVASKGPLSPEQGVAAKMGYNAVLSGKNVPTFVTDKLWPDKNKHKYTASDRKADLAKKISLGKATKAEKEEFELLIQADPMDALRRNLIKNYNKPPPKPPAKPSFGDRLKSWIDGQ